MVKKCSYLIVGADAISCVKLGFVECLLVIGQTQRPFTITQQFTKLRLQNKRTHNLFKKHIIKFIHCGRKSYLCGESMLLDDDNKVN